MREGFLIAGKERSEGEECGTEFNQGHTTHKGLIATERAETSTATRQGHAGHNLPTGNVTGLCLCSQPGRTRRAPPVFLCPVCCHRASD